MLIRFINLPGYFKKLHVYHLKEAIFYDYRSNICYDMTDIQSKYTLLYRIRRNFSESNIVF